MRAPAVKRTFPGITRLSSILCGQTVTCEAIHARLIAGTQITSSTSRFVTPCYPPEVLFRCQAILFDLDGVLVDSTASVARIWGAWALEHKFDPEHVIEHAHGRRTVETVRMVAPYLNAEQEARKLENTEIEDKDGLVVIAGAAEFMRSLPPDRFTVVTSGTRALASARLNYVGLPLPRRFVTADDVSNGKPHPEPYLKGAALLGFAPNDCLVFEDTPAGIAAAKAAGMQAIALTTTYPPEELKAADAMIATFAGINAVFDGHPPGTTALPPGIKSNGVLIVDLSLCAGSLLEIEKRR